MALTPEKVAQLDALYDGGVSTLTPEKIAALDAIYAPTEEKGFAENAWDAAKGLHRGFEQGLTLGFNDKIKAGLATGIAKAAGMVNKDWASPLDIKDQYAIIKDQIDQEGRQIEADAPVSSFIGNLGGAVATGSGIANLAKGTKLAELAAKYPKLAASGAGGVSGGLYAAGTGDITSEEGLRAAGLSTGIGLAAGPVGAIAAQKMGPYLAKKAGGAVDRVSRLFHSPKSVSVIPEEITDIAAQRASQIGNSSDPVSNAALTKVIDRLKQDYPDTWEQVLDAWRNSDAPLADLAQENLTNLAKGAAQYPRGEAVSKKYFAKEIAGSNARATRGLPENFYQSVDDVLEAGREKAAPLYQEAFKANQSISSPLIDRVLETPAGAKALAGAREQMRNQMSRMGVPDAELTEQAIDAGLRAKGGVASGLKMEALDLVKQELDAQARAAFKAANSGNGNTREAQRIADLAADLRNEMDRLDVTAKAGPNSLKPEGGKYAQARAKAGEYLSTEKAMMNGLDIFKPSSDAELVRKSVSKMTEAERTAYKAGVQKAIRNQIDGTVEGVNPYRAVLGTPEKQKRLMQVLSPSEYKTLERTLKIEDRLFKMRNEVLGGSPTTSKALAAAQLTSGGAELVGRAATGDFTGLSTSVIKSTIGKMFDGLSDKTAGHVAQLIFETNPEKKVLLLERTLGSKNLTKPEKELVQKAYFAFDDLVKARTGGAFLGGDISSRLSHSNDDIPHITIHKRAN